LDIVRIDRPCYPITEEGRRRAPRDARIPSTLIWAIEPKAYWTDGQTRAKPVGQDGSLCGQQGGLTLMATTRTPNARSGHGARKLRVKIRGRLVSKFRAGGDSRVGRITLIEAGFFVLVASTIWAIASLSAWWVPVYLVLLVTIFVFPRRRRALSSASDLGAANDAVNLVDLGSGSRVDCADEADQPDSFSRSDSDLTTGEWAESSDANSDLTAADMAKLRRGRVRPRKSARPAAVPVTTSIPVVWIQAEPGKFVRVEGGRRAADSAEDDHALGSVTEEYGIAPSAFSLASEASASVEGSERELTGQVDRFEVETAVCTKAVGQIPPGSADSESLARRPGNPRRRVAQVQREIVHAVPHAGRVSRRRVTRASPNLRTLIRSWFAPNVPRQAAANRAFGRMFHAPYALRTRSPPSRLL